MFTELPEFLVIYAGLDCSEKYQEKNKLNSYGIIYVPHVDKNISVEVFSSFS